MECARCGGKFTTNRQKFLHFVSDIVGFLASREIAAKTLKE
jgi:hypothetical protein